MARPSPAPAAFTLPADAPRHFLDLSRHSAEEISAMLRCAAALKAAPLSRPDLAGMTLAMIFEKPSTRTRVSFEVGMRQLGGQTIMLTGHEMQLGTGETLSDTARVLSRYVNAVMIRTREESRLQEFTAAARVPVINGLTNESHPCQVLADLQTVQERKGRLTDLKIVWSGDGDNNVLTSWMHAAALFPFALHIAAPQYLQPRPDIVQSARGRGARITLEPDVQTAVQDADVIITDTWVSMHQANSTDRVSMLQPFQVNAALMARAGAEVMFLHCLPAHRGEEVTDEVIDSPASAAWDAAENRLHAQKAILLWCFDRPL